MFVLKLTVLKVKDKLTPEEIKRAKGVIIASDKKVDMPRFNGKNLL